MPLFNRLLEIPFFENWLPDRMKPIKEDFVSDQYSHALLKETEKFLEDIIQLSEIERINRTFKRKTAQLKIVVKIKKKRIRLDISDQKHSEAPIKKRIIIEVYRKIYKANQGVGKIVEATIYYTYQGHSFVRSVRRSPIFKGIFYKIDMLDDSLIGRLVKDHETIAKHKTSDVALTEKQEELQNLLVDIKRFTIHNQSLAVDPIIDIKLQKIITEIEKIVPDFHFLQIEERYMIKRVLREDLPNLLHSYLALSLTQQLEQKENIIIALSRIESKIIILLNQMENMKLERIEHLLKLNKIRYEE